MSYNLTILQNFVISKDKRFEVKNGAENKIERETETKAKTEAKTKTKNLNLKLRWEKGPKKGPMWVKVKEGN